MIPEDLVRVLLRCQTDGGSPPPQSPGYNPAAWQEWHSQTPKRCESSIGHGDDYTYHDQPGEAYCSLVFNHTGPHIADGAMEFGNAYVIWW